MLKFRAIGDGNCLYNAEAVFLVRAFLNNKLEPLFKNKGRLKAFHEILQTLQLNNVITVGDKPTIAVVKAGFQQLIKNFTLEEGVIDWLALQAAVAPSLREYVQSTIIDEEAIQQKVKVELTRAFDQCVDMAYLDNHDIQNALPQTIDIESINGAHFEGMDTIIKKVKEILENDAISTRELKKIAIGEWFFGGDAIGFGEYLQGENGIGNPSIHAGDIELNVLSAKLGIVHKTYMRGAIDNEQSATYYNAFKTQDNARKLTKNALVFAFEKSREHWDCLFADTPENQAWLVADEQRVKLAEMDAHAATFGSLDAHRQSLELSVEDYCTLYGLTDEQFRKANLAKPLSAKAKQDIPLDPPVTTSAPVVTPAAPVITPVAPVITSAPVLPRIEPALASNAQNYWKHFATATLAIIFLSHCFVMPILQATFIGLSHISLIGVAVLTALSALGGFAYAEKMETQLLSSNVVANQSSHSVVSDAKSVINNVVDLQDNSRTLVAYYNTQAQEQKREQQIAMNDRPSGPRHKLH